MAESAHCLGKNIARRRKQLRLTQGGLAAGAGVSQSYISALERSERTNVALDTLEQIAEALSTTVEMLLMHNDEKVVERAIHSSRRPAQ